MQVIALLQFPFILLIFSVVALFVGMKRCRVGGLKRSAESMKCLKFVESIPEDKFTIVKFISDEVQATSFKAFWDHNERRVRSNKSPKCERHLIIIKTH